MTSEEFISNHISQQINALLQDGHYHAAFVMMAQSIEVLGAFLDNKPFKAKAQSKIRFRNAIFHLFPSKYTKANRKDQLYHQFRSSMAHMLIPSKHIELVSDSRKHLSNENGKLILNANQLFSDIENAGKTIIEGLKTGKIKDKNIGL
jgi:hypothetical protein